MQSITKWLSQQVDDDDMSYIRYWQWHKLVRPSKNGSELRRVFSGVPP